MSTPLAVTVCVWGRGEEEAGHVCIGEGMHVPLGLKRVQFVLPCVVMCFLGRQRRPYIVFSFK